MEQKSVGKIIATIARNGMKHIDKKLKDLGLGFGQFQILVELNEGEKIKQDEIALRVCVDKTTLARTIKKLEELELIVRVESPNDSRAYEVSVTDKGVVAQKEIKKILKNYTSKLLQGFDKEESKLLISLLEIVLENSNQLE